MIANVLFVWPLVSWAFVPLLVGLVYLTARQTGEGGWDLILFLPFVVLFGTPLFAVFDLLPRVALRSENGVGEERGGKVVLAMLVHWSLLLVLPFVYRGWDDYGSSRSALGSAFYSVPESTWASVGIAAVIGSGIAWGVAIAYGHHPSLRRAAGPEGPPEDPAAE